MKRRPKRKDGTDAHVISGYEYMILSQEDMEMLYSLWPLEQPMENFGTLYSFGVDVDTDGCWLFIMFDLNRPYEETAQALTEYIEGEWETDDESASVIVITEDGTFISCILDKTYGIALECLVEPAPWIKGIVEAYWPPLLRLPGEISNRSPDAYEVTVTGSDDVALSGEWSISKGEADLIDEWTRELMGSSLSEMNGSFNINGIHMDINVEEDSVDITLSRDYRK